MTTPPTQTLYRQLLRHANNLKDYNFRMYALRRVKVGFRKNQTLSGDEAQMAIKRGQEQLEMLKRQEILSNMYPSAKSVMEV